MRIAKKFSSMIIAIVVIAMLAVTAWATGEILVTYSGELDNPVLCENERGTTVKFTIKPSHEITMDSLHMQVNVPAGWTITAIENEDINLTEAQYNLENGAIVWFDLLADGKPADLLATVTVQVPADAEKKTYEIGCEIIDVSRQWGTAYLDKSVFITQELTIGDHADGTNVDHKCDACGDNIGNGECIYVPGKYTWSEDYSTCTVIGTCACGKTAEATVESSITNETAGDCQNEKEVTYTADFAESWAEDQTKTVKGDKDMTKHVGETTTKYTDNEDGKTHTVTVKCACGETLSSNSMDHADTTADHKCDDCKTVLSECSDVDNDGNHNCDLCGELKSKCEDSDTNHICDTDKACVAYKSGEYEHKDGEDVDTVCDYCFRPIKCDVCKLDPVAEVPATCQTPGSKAYYYCTVCTICYEDEAGKTMIEDLGAWKEDTDGGKLPVNENAHIGNKATSYTDNKDGKTHTVTVTYDVCGHESSCDPAVDHDFTNGNCICGAKKPVTGLKGDVDLDGDVDMEDFVALAKHIGEVEFITDSVAMKNADVTDDDVVDMNDFTKLAQFIGEVIDEL